MSRASLTNRFEALGFSLRSHFPPPNEHPRITKVTFGRVRGLAASAISEWIKFLAPAGPNVPTQVGVLELDKEQLFKVWDKVRAARIGVVRAIGNVAASNAEADAAVVFAPFPPHKELSLKSTKVIPHPDELLLGLRFRAGEEHLYAAPALQLPNGSVEVPAGGANYMGVVALESLGAEGSDLRRRMQVY